MLQHASAVASVALSDHIESLEGAPQVVELPCSNVAAPRCLRLQGRPKFNPVGHGPVAKDSPEPAKSLGPCGVGLSGVGMAASKREWRKEGKFRRGSCAMYSTDAFRRELRVLGYAILPYCQLI